MFSLLAEEAVSIKELAQEFSSTSLQSLGGKLCCYLLQARSVSKTRFANKSFAADSTILPLHIRRVKKAFCQALCREMRMHQAVSFVVNQILKKMQCSDEPMISICSFFCRKPNLLVPSCSVKIAHTLYPLTPRHSSHRSLL